MQNRKLMYVCELGFLLAWLLLHRVLLHTHKQRVVTFPYSKTYLSHFSFTSFFMFRSQMISFQFYKEPVSETFIGWKCNFGTLTVFRCGLKHLCGAVPWNLLLIAKSPSLRGLVFPCLEYPPGDLPGERISGFKLPWLPQTYKENVCNFSVSQTSFPDCC